MVDMKLYDFGLITVLIITGITTMSLFLAENIKNQKESEVEIEKIKQYIEYDESYSSLEEVV